MSNRSAHQSSSRGYRGKTQMKFVPKTQNSAPTNHNPTLSSSLRQSLSGSTENRPSAGRGGGASSQKDRVRLGENGEWVSSRSRGGGGGDGGGWFVNYLPQDEAVAVGLGTEEGGLDPIESQRVVDLLNRELARLLKLKPRDFWREGFLSIFCSSI